MLADIPKPTSTPVPTATPLSDRSRPRRSPTETPGLMEMSIVDTSSTSSGSADVAPSYSGSKYILVDISEQHMYVYENDQLLYSFIASTGINNGTRTGLFHVQSKIPNAYGANVEYLDAQLAWHLLGGQSGKMASMPCPFCLMEQSCGPGILAAPFPTDAWCWVPTRPACFITGLKLAYRWRFGGKISYRYPVCCARIIQAHFKI